MINESALDSIKWKPHAFTVKQKRVVFKWFGLYVPFISYWNLVILSHWTIQQHVCFSPLSSNQRSKATFVKQIVGELQSGLMKTHYSLLGDITFLIIPLIGLISSKDYCTFSWRLMSSFMNIQNNPAALGQHWLLLWNSEELLQMSCWRLLNSSLPFSIWFYHKEPY